ncbi:uncharacterized protein ACNLHF_024902 [Anomaloglossus baeobatrachus]
MENHNSGDHFDTFLTNSQLEECMSPGFNNIFSTLNYGPSEDVIDESNVPGFHQSVTDTEMMRSVYMMENNQDFETAENRDSDIELVEVHCSSVLPLYATAENRDSAIELVEVPCSPVLPPAPNAPKKSGKSIRRDLKNRKDVQLLAKNLEFAKENIPIPSTSFNEKTTNPGPVEVQYATHASTSSLQRCNYDSPQITPQRANVIVRTTPLSRTKPLSPSNIVNREDTTASIKYPRNSVPKKREARATSPKQPGNLIPKAINMNTIRVQHTEQPSVNTSEGSSSDFGIVMPLKKRSDSKRRVSKKQRVDSTSAYTVRPVWADEQDIMLTAMSGQYVQCKLYQNKLKYFCDTYERFMNAYPTSDIIAELSEFKREHAIVLSQPNKKESL